MSVLGDVAFEAKSNVRTLLPHPPLHIVGVYESLLKIARAKGSGAGKQKQAVVVRVLSPHRPWFPATGDRTLSLKDDPRQNRGATYLKMDVQVQLEETADSSLTATRRAPSSLSCQAHFILAFQESSIRTSRHFNIIHISTTPFHRSIH